MVIIVSRIEYSWKDLTKKLAFVENPSERDKIKQQLLAEINNNKKNEKEIRLDNENYFARDLMDWVRDRGAEGEIKKAIDFFEILKNLSSSESIYAVDCYIAGQNMIHNLSEDLWIQHITEVSNTSKANFMKEINSQNACDGKSQHGREMGSHGMILYTRR